MFLEIAFLGSKILSPLGGFPGTPHDRPAGYKRKEKKETPAEVMMCPLESPGLPDR